MLSRYYSVHHAQVTICDRCICYLIEVVKGIISIDTKCGDVEKATSCSCAICLLSVPRSCLITNVSCWISSALSSNNDLRLATNTHTHIHNYTYTHAFHFNSHFPSESGSPCGYLARFLQAKKPFLSPNQQCQRQWKERKPLSGESQPRKITHRPHPFFNHNLTSAGRVITFPLRQQSDDTKTHNLSFTLCSHISLAQGEDHASANIYNSFQSSISQ